jgi:hypothetical protein
MLALAQANGLKRVMAGPYVYDKSKYHMGDGPQFAPSWERASAPALFILRWMIDRNLLDAEFWKGASDSLEKYKSRQMSLYKLYERECDLCLINDMFSEEGNAFGQLYFDYEKGRYIADLERVLQFKGYPEFTDEAYERVRPVIDERYEIWKGGGTEETKKQPQKWWSRWFGQTGRS